MKESKLMKKILDKYHITDGQKISKYELENIANEEKIELKDLVFLLGCYRKIIYKTDEKWTKIKIYNRKISTRDVVNIIKLDLKYINEYGSRFYTKEEIIKICNEYNIDFHVFLTYIYKYKICYYGNIDILENNKQGLWIGERQNLSDKFIKENYTELKNSIEKIAENLVYKYDCRWLKEKIVDLAKEYMFNFGNIEKNYNYDINIVKRKILYKLRYIMLENIIDEYKYIYDDNLIYNLSNKEDALENSIDEWLRDVKLSTIKQILISEIREKLDYVIESRSFAFKNIYEKLGMKRNTFYMHIKEIQEILINNEKVRITRKGGVLLVNE